MEDKTSFRSWEKNQSTKRSFKDIITYFGAGPNKEGKIKWVGRDREIEKEREVSLER